MENTGFAHTDHRNGNNAVAAVTTSSEPLPEMIRLRQSKDIETYKPSPALQAVIKMAVALGRPLLLAGKPGVGKTQFAHWFAANQDGFNSKVFQFNTKSTSIFTDLFYEYDAVAHFRDANIKKAETDAAANRTAADYITLTALGFAIACAQAPGTKRDPALDKIIENTKPKFGVTEDLLKKTVVLIDEIDKAPRDFPNDLLHEIERLSFTIKEINQTIQLDDPEKENIVIILTSNDEKNLPDAFLRRCLFHYIDFPDEAALKEIVRSKLDLEHSPHFDDKMAWFRKIYAAKTIDKKPSTAECIDWINYLHKNNMLGATVAECENTFSILVKKKQDLDELKNVLSEKQAGDSTPGPVAAK